MCNNQSCFYVTVLSALPMFLLLYMIWNDLVKVLGYRSQTLHACTLTDLWHLLCNHRNKHFYRLYIYYCLVYWYCTLSVIHLEKEDEGVTAVTHVQFIQIYFTVPNEVDPSKSRFLLAFGKSFPPVLSCAWC